MQARALYSTVFETAFGWIGLVRSGTGLGLCTLPKKHQEECLGEIERKAGAAREDRSAFDDLPDRLRRYFQGEAVSFPDPLDLEGKSAFHRAVLSKTHTIPYGQTTTYLWLAQQVDKPGAARAVGRAMATNPLPIVVPCHRVLGSDGSLHGFGGGLPLKERMLRLEGAWR